MRSPVFIYIFEVCCQGTLLGTVSTLLKFQNDILLYRHATHDFYRCLCRAYFSIPMGETRISLVYMFFFAGMEVI